MTERKRKKLKFSSKVSATPMPVEDWHTSQRILAKLIARAFAADHPELFGPKLQETLARRSGEDM